MRVPSGLIYTKLVWVRMWYFILSAVAVSKSTLRIVSHDGKWLARKLFSASIQVEHQAAWKKSTISHVLGILFGS